MCLMESVYLSVYLYVIEKPCACVSVSWEYVYVRVCKGEKKYKIVHVVDKLWSVRLSVNHFTWVVCANRSLNLHTLLRLGAEIWT